MIDDDTFLRGLIDQERESVRPSFTAADANWAKIQAKLQAGVVPAVLRDPDEGSSMPEPDVPEGLEAEAMSEALAGAVSAGAAKGGAAKLAIVAVVSATLGAGSVVAVQSLAPPADSPGPRVDTARSLESELEVAAENLSTGSSPELAPEATADPEADDELVFEPVVADPKPAVKSKSPGSRTPRRRRTPRRSARAQVPSTPVQALDPAALDAESRLLGRAQTHRSRKQYRLAQEALAQHRRRFPDGVLAPERDALQAIVDCERVGPADRGPARERARRLLRKRRGSAQSVAVRDACDLEGK